jgi:hypothetical protein
MPTISLILKFPQQPYWQIIQLEGDEDIEDILIFDYNSEIVLRAQVKQKQDPYQWKPGDTTFMRVANLR